MTVFVVKAVVLVCHSYFSAALDRVEGMRRTRDTHHTHLSIQPLCLMYDIYFHTHYIVHNYVLG